MAKPSPSPAPEQQGYARKRAKTRGLLLAAARRVMAQKGVDAATITDIAAEADVAPGTFYNYFSTREEVLEAVATELVEEFARVMAAIERTVEDPAQRLAYSIRLFLGRVREDPLWGWFMVRFGPSLPILRDRTREIIRGHILADGLRRKRFRLTSTRAVGDLIAGTSVTALRSILEDDAAPEIAEEIAELLLRALGLPLAEARRVARLPLPELRRRNPS